MVSGWPSYLALCESGELARRTREAVDAMEDCTCCPRQCHADRRRQDSPQSYCRTGRLAVVSGACPHPGEEDCLRGWAGSGTIFFSQCNLRCMFCGWHEIRLVAEQGS
jgi:putative pyruvate formate lyase activating enzyme